MQDRERCAGRCEPITNSGVAQETKYFDAALLELHHTYKNWNKLSQPEKDHVNSRLIHMYNRVRRLQPKTRENQSQAAGLTERVSKMLDIFGVTPNVPPQGHRNTSRAEQTSVPLQIQTNTPSAARASVSDMQISHKAEHARPEPRAQPQNLGAIPKTNSHEPRRNLFVRPPNQDFDKLVNRATPPSIFTGYREPMPPHRSESEFRNSEILSSTLRNAQREPHSHAGGPNHQCHSGMLRDPPLTFPSVFGPVTYHRSAPEQPITRGGSNLEAMQQMQAHTNEMLQKFENSMLQFMENMAIRNRNESHPQPYRALDPNQVPFPEASDRESATSRRNRRSAQSHHRRYSHQSIRRSRSNTSFASQSNSDDETSSGSSSDSSANSDCANRQRLYRRNPNHRTQHAQKKPLGPQNFGFMFSGDKDSSDKRDLAAPEFLRALDSVRKSENYSKETTVSFLIALLRGSAKSWWMNVSKKIGQSYSRFKKEFRKQWFEDDYETSAYIDLVAFKQKSEPVMKYLINFETKANCCSPQLSDKQMVSLLKRNLNEDYRHCVKLSKAKTLAAVKKVCKEFSSDKDKKTTGGPIDRNPNRVPRFQNDNRRDRHVFAVECLGAEYNTDDEEEKYSPYEVCVVRRVDEQGDKREFKCYNCKQIGHAWRNCPTPITTPFCMHCGKEGVKITTCERQACRDFYQTRLRKRAEKAGQAK